MGVRDVLENKRNRKRPFGALVAVGAVALLGGVGATLKGAATKRKEEQARADNARREREEAERARERRAQEEIERARAEAERAKIEADARAKAAEDFILEAEARKAAEAAQRHEPRKREREPKTT